MRSTLLGLVGMSALVVLGYLALAWSLQRRVMYPSPVPPATDVAGTIPGLEVVRLGPGGGVEAWLLPGDTSVEPGPAVIFAHGNGELIDYWAGEFESFRARGVTVMLVEYPGYGRSAGSPSQRSITETFVEAYDVLAARRGAPGAPIVGYGRSLGGGAVCRLSLLRPLAGLVLESSFTGVAPLARGMGVPRALVRDPFDNLEALGRFDGPVLILHGERDRIVPFEHARALHAASDRATLRAMPCGHNDCPRPWSDVLAFLDGVR